MQSPPTRPLDESVGEFLNRLIESDWPYLWIDATYGMTREAGGIARLFGAMMLERNDE